MSPTVLVFDEPCYGVISLALMPLFHFAVREGQRVIPDQEGSDCPDLDAAEREAAEAAAQIGRDLLSDGKAQAVSIEVEE